MIGEVTQTSLEDLRLVAASAIFANVYGDCIERNTNERVLNETVVRHTEVESTLTTAAEMVRRQKHLTMGWIVGTWCEDVSGIAGGLNSANKFFHSSHFGIISQLNVPIQCAL